MSYKVIDAHDDGCTMAEIAKTFGLTGFGKGMGYYELIKAESVSSKKGLVLWQNKFISNDVKEIRAILGVSESQKSISPSNVPTGMKLFVQSTSPNRKISSASAVLYSLDVEQPEEEEKIMNFSSSTLATTCLSQRKSDLEAKWLDDCFLPFMRQFIDGKVADASFYQEEPETLAKRMGCMLTGNASVTMELIAKTPDILWGSDVATMLGNPNMTFSHLHQMCSTAATMWKLIGSSLARERMSSHPRVTMADVNAHAEYPWDVATLCLNPNMNLDFLLRHWKHNLNSMSSDGWFALSRHPNVTMEMVTANPELKWNWLALSMNPNITVEFVLANSDKPLSMEGISAHPCITMEYVANSAGPGAPLSNLLWSYSGLAKNPNLTFAFVQTHLEQFAGSPLAWSYISKHANVTLADIAAHPELPWNYESIGSHPHLTVEFILAHMTETWNFAWISRNPSITMDAVLSNLSLPWDLTYLSKNPNLTMAAIQQINEHRQLSFSKAWTPDLLKDASFAVDKMAYIDRILTHGTSSVSTESDGKVDISSACAHADHQEKRENNVVKGGKVRRDEESSSSSSSKKPRIPVNSHVVPMLVKFDRLKELRDVDVDAEVEEEEYINGQVGVAFNGCDESPPRELINESLNHFTQLLLVDWYSVDIAVSTMNIDATPFIHTVCAYGRVPAPAGCGEQGKLVRFEYYFPQNGGDVETLDVTYTAVSVEKDWGCVVSCMCSHPSVQSREIKIECSDGSGPGDTAIAPLPAGSSNQQIMLSMIAHTSKLYYEICTMNG